MPEDMGIHARIIMTKAELVALVSQQTGLGHEDVLAVVESTMANIKRSLTDGEAVFLRGFGSFTLKKRAEKMARNITRNTTMMVPAHNIPFFKPSPEFKDAVAATPLAD